MFRPLVTMKHWHMFLGIFGIPFVVQFIAMFSVFAKVSANNKPDPQDILTIFYVLPIIMLTSVYFTYGWQWAIFKYLKDRIPAEVKIPIKRIKVFYIIQVLYLMFIVIGVTTFMYQLFSHPDPEHFFKSNEPPVAFIMLTLVAFPFHLFVIFAQFHNMYFAGKTFKAVEVQKKVKFEDFAAEFFLIWFHFIGVWILQPRLNKLVNGTTSSNESKNVVDDVSLTKDDEVI